jgi:hypothetical protein
MYLPTSDSQNKLPHYTMKPTTEMILEFASSIGVTDMFISPRYNKPGDVLHELAHNAVCTDLQLTRRTMHKSGKGVLIPDTVYHPGIMSPNEFGARVWGLEVLQYFNWETPPNTGNPCIYSGEPGDVKDGQEQLREWGIEPLLGIFRPVKTPTIQQQRRIA